MTTSFHVAKLAGNFILILFFYASSISLTFYNKWMSKRYRFPLTISMVHFVVVFLIAAILRKIWELYNKEKRVLLDWEMYLKRVSPSAIAGALDVGLSNWSIMLSTVSLYTMAKSSVILFILFFSVLFRLEKPTWLLFLVVVLISSGLFLFTFEAKQFNVGGFSLAILASMMGGIRWTTAQLIMQKQAMGLRNPIDAIYHIQPLMALVMVFLAFSVEGKQVASSKLLFHASSAHVGLVSFLIIMGGALLAFVLTCSEYLVVSYTSGITLSIAGIFKEVCTLSIAAEFGGDKWTILNFVGLVICMMGISVHVVTKALKETEQSEVVEEPITEDNAMISLLRRSSSDEEVVFDKASME